MTHCPSCQNAVEEPHCETCPSCGWKFNLQSQSKPRVSIVRRGIRQKIPVALELAITIDRTGSSDQFRDGIPLTAKTIFEVVEAKAAKVITAVQTHGDFDDGQDMILLTDRGTPDQAFADINGITYSGGGDPPEHHLDAIENLAKIIPWTRDPAKSRGAILAFLTAESKPARSGISAADLGRRIRNDGLLLYLVCEPTPVLTELCEAAEGMMFRMSNTPELSELQKIGTELAKSIIVTAAAGSTVPMTA
jgi:hypothetical protein